jgi:hypothetical protein
MRNSGDVITDRTGVFTGKDAAKIYRKLAADMESWLRKKGGFGRFRNRLSRIFRVSSSFRPLSLLISAKR